MREKLISGEYTGWTKKGICFDVKLIPEFIKNLKEAEGYLDKTKHKDELVKIIEFIDKGERIDISVGEKLIKYCYEDEHFKEAIEIFKLIDEEECSKEIKKIIDVCRLKIE